MLHWQHFHNSCLIWISLELIGFREGFHRRRGPAWGCVVVACKARAARHDREKNGNDVNRQSLSMCWKLCFEFTTRDELRVNGILSVWMSTMRAQRVRCWTNDVVTFRLCFLSVTGPLLCGVEWIKKQTHVCGELEFYFSFSLAVFLHADGFAHEWWSWLKRSWGFSVNSLIRHSKHHLKFSNISTQIDITSAPSPPPNSAHIFIRFSTHSSRVRFSLKSRRPRLFGSAL